MEDAGGKKLFEKQAVGPQTVEVAVSQVEAVDAVGIEQQFDPNVAMSEDDLHL